MKIAIEPLSICCTFCGQRHGEVDLLIAKDHVHICDECVDLAYGLVTEHRRLKGDVTVEDRATVLGHAPKYVQQCVAALRTTAGSE